MTLNSPPKAEDETLDSFCLGKIFILQKKKGYRFAVDAPLLADFIRTERSDELLELGAGNGVISVLLSIKPFKHITAVEIQGTLADLARRNIALNRLEKRITVIEEDLRRFKPDKMFDVIFSNPPYIRKGEGQLSSSLEKSIAKHELECDIFDVMNKTGELLKRSGRACFIFIAKREKDFFEAAEKGGLKVRSLRYVHPRQDSPPNMFLAECDYSAEKKIILPPFILYDKNENYTAEAEAVFRGRVEAGKAR